MHGEFGAWSGSPMNTFGHCFKSAAVLLVDRFISFRRRARSIAILTADAPNADLALGKHADTLLEFH